MVKIFPWAAIGTVVYVLEFFTILASANMSLIAYWGRLFIEIVKLGVKSFKKVVLFVGVTQL